MRSTHPHHTRDLLDSLHKNYQVDLEGLIATVKGYNPDFNEQKFREAFEFAALAHEGQVRKQQGLPYIVHPFETAKILTTIHADETTLIASLLHDVPEDTSHSLEEIEKRFGKQVAYMVEGITKLSKVHYRHDMQQREVESMKRLFIHVAEDPRTMLIKLADRLHNMRTLEYMDVPEKRLRKARETLEIFTPIASLLGIKELQAELEDLCFINLFPQDYAKLRAKVQEAREKHLADQEKMIVETEKALKKNQIDAIVYAYQENLYRTYNRLKRAGREIEDLEVTFLINVIVNDVSGCYEALGIIHSLYKPQPGKIKDYVSLPKANGYQSLHTTVFGHKGINTKYCIRTNQMHFEAQYGIAASYFSPDSHKRKLFGSEDPRSHWVEDAIQIHREQNQESKYFDELKNYVFQDRINVFTPKGMSFDLPVSATCIDFAYCIHTEVGHRAIRAVVNGNNVPLDYQLSKGDVVRIITTDYLKGPSYEWLGFAKTPQARKSMRDYFKKESATSKMLVGRRMLQKEYDRAGLGLVSNLPKWKIQRIAQNYPSLNIQTTENLLVLIAEGTISTLELIGQINEQSRNKPDLQEAEVGMLPRQKLTKLSIRVTCDSTVNFSELANALQKRKDSFFLISGDTRYDFLNNKIVYRANMLVRGYSDISNICRELESVPGVEEVRRLFFSKKIFVLLGGFLTFAFWAVHPLALYYITSVWQAGPEEVRLVANTVLFAGLFILFSLIFSLKTYSENSFPEYREGSRLWQLAYLLSFFALLTVFMEIYLYKLNFDWAWVLASVILIFAYLTGQYIYYRDKNQ